MAAVRNYSIGKNRIRKGCLENMELAEDGRVICDPAFGVHTLFLECLDSGIPGCQWGRFHFTGSFAENMVVIVRAAANDEREMYSREELIGVDAFLTDKDRGSAEKKRLLDRLDGIKAVNCRDVLLYSLSGRYLWIALEVLGAGPGSVEGMQVNLEGDNFMYTFPEIYQERNSFFHRYLSVFSSIYNDFQLKTDHLADIIDIDTAPAPLLPLFGRWLGLDVGLDVLEEPRLRRLLKEACQLNKYKGTVQTVQRVIEIVLDEKAIIIERNLMRDLIPFEEKEIYEKLYGDSPYDITVLMEGEENKNKRARLTFLLRQFVPLRVRLKLVFLGEKGMLDTYCYLDRNAKIYEYVPGSLDRELLLDGSLVLL